MENVVEKSLGDELVFRKLFSVDYMNVCGDSGFDYSFEVKRRIVDALQELQSDSPGSTNTITIEQAIDIVNGA